MVSLLDIRADSREREIASISVLGVRYTFISGPSVENSFFTALVQSSPNTQIIMLDINLALLEGLSVEKNGLHIQFQSLSEKSAVLLDFRKISGAINVEFSNQEIRTEFLVHLPATLTESPDSQLVSQQPHPMDLSLVDDEDRFDIGDYEESGEITYTEGDNQFDGSMKHTSKASPPALETLGAQPSLIVPSTSRNSSRKTYSRAAAKRLVSRKRAQPSGLANPTETRRKTHVARLSPSASDTHSTSGDSMPRKRLVRSEIVGPRVEASQRTNYDSPPPLPDHKTGATHHQRKIDPRHAARKRPIDDKEDKDYHPLDKKGRLKSRKLSGAATSRKSVNATKNARQDQEHQSTLRQDDAHSDSARNRPAEDVRKNPEDDHVGLGRSALKKSVRSAPPSLVAQSVSGGISDNRVLGSTRGQGTKPQTSRTVTKPRIQRQLEFRLSSPLKVVNDGMPIDGNSIIPNLNDEFDEPAAVNDMQMDVEEITNDSPGSYLSRETESHYDSVSTNKRTVVSKKPSETKQQDLVLEQAEPIRKANTTPIPSQNPKIFLPVKGGQFRQGSALDTLVEESSGKKRIPEAKKYFSLSKVVLPVDEELSSLENTPTPRVQNTRLPQTSTQLTEFPRESDAHRDRYNSSGRAIELDPTFFGKSVMDVESNHKQSFNLGNKKRSLPSLQGSGRHPNNIRSDPNGDSTNRSSSQSPQQSNLNRAWDDNHVRDEFRQRLVQKGIGILFSRAEVEGPSDISYISDSSMADNESESDWDAETDKVSTSLPQYQQTIRDVLYEITEVISFQAWFSFPANVSKVLAGRKQ
jgi:hypothetical protein